MTKTVEWKSPGRVSRSRVRRAVRRLRWKGLLRPARRIWQEDEEERLLQDLEALGPPSSDEPDPGKPLN